jgi:hypothetical protein
VGSSPQGQVSGAAQAVFEVVGEEGQPTPRLRRRPRTASPADGTNDQPAQRDTTEEIMTRYREPLVRAAYDIQGRIYNLQGRIYNIVSTSMAAQARPRRGGAVLRPDEHAVRARRVPGLGRETAPRRAVPRPRRPLPQPRAGRAARPDQPPARERAKVDASELRTLAAYVTALGGRLKVVADFGDERLVIG